MSNIITGFTPSGEITIANYLGVIKPLVSLQKNNRLFVFCANLHAITEISSEKDLNKSAQLLKKNSYKLIASLIACGVDFKKNLLFMQSINRDHFELFYYLVCFSKLGSLKRMTQFKTKNTQKGNQSSISVGLLIYPCLMAADILLYNSDIVLVGKDQKQHLEFCNQFLDSWTYKHKSIKPFKRFKAQSNLKTQKILALDNPQLKMSKSSSNPGSYISMFDSPTAVTKKIRAAITDSENTITYLPSKQPGISNLITIYSEITGLSILEIENLYIGKNYCIFKEDLITKLNIFLSNFQKKFKEYNKISFLQKLLLNNNKKLLKISDKTVSIIRNELGIQY